MTGKSRKPERARLNPALRPTSYNALRPDLFAAAQRALSMAEIRALPAADILRLGLLEAEPDPLAARSRAQRRRAASRILSRPSALSLRPERLIVTGPGEPVPSICSNSP